MDTYEAISTKLDVRVFATKHVDGRLKAKVLESARLTASSMNSQHWRFILVQEPKSLATLAQDSTSGTWVKGSDFAVIVSIDPKIPGSTIDAGRVVQDMQLAAWEEGVASGVFTGIRSQALRKDFGIPEDLNPVIVAGFGYPKRKLLGRKNRKPLSEIAFLERFGAELSFSLK
ncbi:MAG: nitroreductase family protein [Thaumarchaeota archaeon]|nr:nitroreductase family protein [Nitrososphaerota archaeon]